MIFAKYPYRVSSINGLFIEIYDEEPDNLHTDMVLASSCNYIDRDKTLKIIKNERN